MNVDEQRICAELWAEHESLIQGLCVFKLQSCPVEIEDVVADVCLALCEKVSKSGPPEKPKEWLIGVFYNLLNSKYKEIYAQRENETSYSDEEFDLPFCDDSFRKKDNELLVADLLYKAKGKLKNDDYALLDYTFNKCFKAKEIAADINKSEDAVKQKRYRIYQKLRKIYKSMDK